MIGTIEYLGMYFLLEGLVKISQRDVKSSLKPDYNIDLSIEKLEIQYQEENYQHCYQLAINDPNQDNLLIQEWLGKCGLVAAKQQADFNSFGRAIAIAQTIPDTVSEYQEIQDNINIWSRKILDYATKLYQQGNLEEAIKTTQIIPENSNLNPTIPNLISQWQQEETKHKTIIDNAQNLLNKGQWSAAKQEVAKIPTDFIFWRQQAEPILEVANQKINAIVAVERNRRRQKQRLRVQPKKSKLLPSLRERLKNTPLLDDDTLRERLQRNSKLPKKLPIMKD